MVRRLILTEFRTTHAVTLKTSERDAVRRLHPGIRVEPTPGTTDRYDLTPDQRIGIVCLPSLVLEIRPKVPIASVLFLVSHACEAATWFDEHPQLAPDADLVELLAVMLAKLVERTTRRGLLNGYQSEEESLAAPRGRILFDEQVRRRLGISPPIEVRHDVFTPDIIENRLLLAALGAMGRIPLGQQTRREVSRAQRLFGGVRRLYFPAASVPDVVFTRLNHHYQPAVSLATLVLRSAALDLGQGAASGSAFLIDMNAVFERFVRSALREALQVNEGALPSRPPRIRLDEGGVVPLKPDLCLVSGQRIVWVGDAKYKRLPSGAYQNADLYQVLAYAVALGLPGGTLIYAADEGVRHAEHVVVRAGKHLRVVALDLAAPPKGIRQQVAQIASDVQASLARAKAALSRSSPTVHASALKDAAATQA